MKELSRKPDVHERVVILLKLISGIGDEKRDTYISIEIIITSTTKMKSHGQVNQKRKS